MRRTLDLLSTPFLIFLVIVGISLIIAFLIAGTAIVAVILKAATNFFVFELWTTIAAMLSDPWKLVALPICAGAAIVLFRGIFNDSDDFARPPVIRGRRLGESRGQQNLSRPANANKKTAPDRTPPRQRPSR